MTEEQLQAIKERAEKATDGPWKVGKASPNGAQNIGTVYGLLTAQTTREENAEFIANARQDIPQLVAEVERLREGLETIANHNIFKVPQIMMRDYAREVLEGEK